MFDIVKVVKKDQIRDIGHYAIITKMSESSSISISITYIDGHHGMCAWFQPHELVFVSRPIDYAETPEEWHRIQFNKKAEKLINDLLFK